MCSLEVLGIGTEWHSPAMAKHRSAKQGNIGKIKTPGMVSQLSPAYFNNEIKNFW